MILSIYKIDAFTNQLFCGNQAAVLPLSQWLSTELMQDIACENNLPITVFFVPNEHSFQIRWFTPTGESSLCGHGTLAAAFVISKLLDYDQDRIHFESGNEVLTVDLRGDWFTLKFSADEYKVAVSPPALLESFPMSRVKGVYKGKLDYMVVLGSQREVIDLDFDIFLVSTVPTRGIIVTAPGIGVDFVSRFFTPQSGIDEDPVTGSTHTMLVPYWSEKLSKAVLTAKQLSRRGGYLACELDGNVVNISGQARLYMQGEIKI